MHVRKRLPSSRELVKGYRVKTIEEFAKVLDLKYLPTAEQTAVITCPLWVEGTNTAAPLLVVAGAGSGKTETMSLRAAYVAASTGIDNSGILGLTFTRKAAAELSERLTERLALLHDVEGKTTDEFDDVPTATTYNSFALDVVREFGGHIGIDTDFRHLDGAASWQLMHDIVVSWEEDISGDRSYRTITDAALSLREDIWNQGITLEQARGQLLKLDNLFDEERAIRKNKLPSFFQRGLEANVVRGQLLRIIARFEEEKALLRRLDFADQVLLAARIVNESKYARETLRQRYPVVFLDEFQDTSVAQMEFLSTVFRDHPVTAVGDPNQAIYGWRGASAASLDDFHRLFSRHEGAPKTVLKLSKAWRNGTKILEIANKISDPLRSGYAHVVGPDLQAPKGAHAGETTGSYGLSFGDQLEKVVDFVRSCREELESHDGRSATVAVLCRRRMPIMLVVDALQQAGIPAETVGSDGLLFHPAVMDTRAALEVTANIASSAALMRLLANLDIGAADLAELNRLATRLAREHTDDRHPTVLLLEAVDACEQMDVKETGLTPAAYRRIRHLASQLRRLRGWRGTSVVEQVQAARRIFGFEEEALATGSALDVVEALDGFERAAYDYESGDLGSTMSGFLDWLKAAEDRERGLSLPSTQADPNAVQVMTVHASKGLEWDAVAVIDLESGVFPSFSSSPGTKTDDGLIGPPPAIPTPIAWWRDPGQLPYTLRRDAEYLPGIDLWGHGCTAREFEASFRENAGEYLLAEERRLAYVAVTRPRFRLGLFGSWVIGSTRRYESVFLSETEGLLDQWEKESCPTQDEATQIAKREASEPFPKRPGKIRKLVGLSVKKVAEQINHLSASADTQHELDVSLEAILDDQRREEVNALLRARDQELARNTRESIGAVIHDAKQSVGCPWILSATEIHGKASASDVWVEIRRPIPKEPSSAAALGTVFHQWVETSLRKLVAEPLEAGSSDTLILNDSIEDSMTERLLTDEQSQELVRLQKNLALLPFLSQVVPVSLEWPFTVTVEGLIVRGRIDAIFRQPKLNEYLLVDWKTGRPHLASEDNVRRHLTQLSLYRMAWERYCDDGIRTKASMVFLGGDAPEVISEETFMTAYESLTGTQWDLNTFVGTLAEELNV